MRNIGTFEDILSEIVSMRNSQDRVIVGIAGCPGSGKSTLAQEIVEALGPRAQMIPMDGFHLAQAVLSDLGMEDRKGAPETFDAAGFVSLLQRVDAQEVDEVIFAPRFDRAIEEPIACAIPIRPETSVIIVEGNYLLLDDAEWRGVRSILDFTCYLSIENSLRESRLLVRHMEFGRTHAEALAWIRSVDNPNAQRIEASQGNAEFVIDIINSVGSA